MRMGTGTRKCICFNFTQSFELHVVQTISTLNVVNFCDQVLVALLFIVLFSFNNAQN